MTGLILILPLAITIILVLFLVNFLTKPFVGSVQSALSYYGFIDAKSKILLLYVSKLFVLIGLFLLTLVLGIIGRWFLQHYLIGLSDLIFHKIPFVNKVYRTCREIVHTLFTPSSKIFQQVVVVPFPHGKSMSIGLISQQKLPEGSFEKLKDYATVLVPGTPNPTMGLVLLYPRNKIQNVDMSVEDALKCIVSCGIILSDFKTQPDQESPPNPTPENSSI